MLSQLNNFLNFFRSATSTVATTTGTVASGFGAMSFDIIVLAIAFFVIFLFGMYFGKAHLVSLIVSFYPAMLLYERLPFLEWFVFLKGENLITLNKLIVFVVLLVLIDIIILRFIFSESKGGPVHFIHIVAGSLAFLILLLILTYSVINLDMIHDFSPTIDNLFMNSPHTFWWNLAPLALLFLI